MSLEGRIRDLGLHEVCQLLGLGRKTGVLELRAPLLGVSAEIRVLHGAIVAAGAWPSDLAEADRQHAPDAASTSECVLELLLWPDGQFRFVSTDPKATPAGPVRLAMEPLLVEGAGRAEVWSRIRDRLPHAGVVPAFVDVDSQQLPLLRLVPQEWEILTRVDGHRTVTELAAVLGRPLLDVATIVHGLIESGLLTLRQAGAVDRRHHDTPPSAAQAVQAVPDHSALFDPDGLSVHDTELWIPDERAIFAASVTTEPTAVASHRDEPSQQEEVDGKAVSVTDAIALCQEGDDAARRGDLAAALHHWSAALRSESLPAELPTFAAADRVREAVALAARLHALLHPAN